jgi:hypothetical protein
MTTYAFHALIVLRTSKRREHGMGILEPVINRIIVFFEKIKKMA